MIPNRTLARRYAWAVGELAKERNVLEQVTSELTSVSDLLRTSPEFYQLLTNEKFTKEARGSILRTLFTGKVHEVALNFLLLVVHKNRAEHLAEITRELQRYADDVQNVLAVRITTAVPLDAAQSQTLQGSLEQLTGRSVRLEPSTDPALIGGVKVQIGDKVLDGSIAGRLRRLKSTLSAARFSRNSGETSSIAGV